jgi:cystathionine beta-lyase
MSDEDHKPGLRPATRLVEAGRRREWVSVPGQPGGVVNPPVWRASTHLYESTADLAKGRPNEHGHFYYGRRGGPTHWALAEAVTGLEPGAEGTELFPSGVAAIAATLLALLRPGDEVLFADNVYEPTRNIALTLLRQYGVTARSFDPLDPDAFAAMIGANTKVAMLENPGSLTMEVCDIPALTAIARGKGVLSVLDNTWATGLGFAAIAHGCDVSLMSLTKHVGGHSDLMLGSVSAAEPVIGRIRRQSQLLGQVISPDDASLALRGIRTMAVRLDRSTASALQIAGWLQARPEVGAVMCPMLPGSPGHDQWARDFTGGCGLFSFTLARPDQAARGRLIDALKLFGIGFSWGGFESLVIPFDPAQIRAYRPLTAGAGLRLSIGLEDAGDLIADLEAGFGAMAAG